MTCPFCIVSKSRRRLLDDAALVQCRVATQLAKHFERPRRSIA
jgi:hypothetical protein